ncbi:anaerobic ribonucleoside-triphosphate reductase activating protein [Candidatus Falkowbacteria bacterium CG10_big_fil_rev_8_21_14_0_10_37_18]|uniref:Anaerobic ribonucleoside-triphosphate reductase activating protein n=1 Tax=Candidatus Falkowbacteria bacterium CG10_big_fil_rev_8_21_14_0_10_37_18 TaxID=1974562 RepID=A0A2H0V9L2_9BACT|nr:anaerobic ribonucleoside-triphosphate reductase activating protein [Candidatus Falkowbacteria bacterium]OIO05431.1 MAG: anaerobic ribonucleoside-triphosphate reductase activating protein [Candidatus Falkowbacteria bacterium CG1_02_37_21]PIR95796.1 MAG: anaerobic ribonucleoside-triphosphate reductase activating protein [Candidatus Falkowbacteria bacterium CG10_big_fil_rev_8_21_14_0_10_37_18]
MIIGGLEKLTLLDYPEHLAAIIFTQGCNFRCHFCYNPLLVLPRNGSDEKEKGMSEFSPQNLFLFLRERVGRLEGVVITGGEPTLHPDLPEFISDIKKLGYLVKLDSNGTNPEMLNRLIKEKLIDYIAMDIKAPLDRYEEVVNTKLDCNKVQKSVKIIIDSGLPYEFRTTVVPGLLTKEDFRPMGELIKGATKWYLQNFKSDTDLVDATYRGHQAYTAQDMIEFAAIGKEYVDLCEVRGE